MNPEPEPDVALFTGAQTGYRTSGLSPENPSHSWRSPNRTGCGAQTGLPVYTCDALDAIHQAGKRAPFFDSPGQARSGAASWSSVVAGQRHGAATICTALCTADIVAATLAYQNATLFFV